MTEVFKEVFKIKADRPLTRDTLNANVRQWARIMKAISRCSRHFAELTALTARILSRLPTLLSLSLIHI